MAGFSDEELVSGCEDSWKKDWVRLVGFSDDELVSGCSRILRRRTGPGWYDLESKAEFGYGRSISKK